MFSPDQWPSDQTLRERIGQARSLINQRPHTPELIDSISLALDGAGVEEIRTIEQTKAGVT